MFNKVVKVSGLGLCLSALMLVGCGHTETTSDGTKVSVEAGGKIQTTDSQGNTATVTDGGKKVTIESKNGNAEYETKNGTVKAHDDKGNSMEMGTGVSEADLGLPFYPGSTEAKDGMKAVTDKQTSIVSNRLTPDAPSKVVDFYTGKLGKPATSMSSDAMTMASWKMGKKAATLMISKSDASYKVSMTVVTDK